MAGEIKQTASLQLTNQNTKIPRLGGSTNSIDQNTRGGGLPGQITAVTAGVDVTTTGITTLGWMFLKNTDSTNFIEWGPKSGGVFYPIGKLKPGEEISFRLSPGKTLHLKADTADCKCTLVILED